MRPSALIDEVVEQYLRDLVSLLPHSSAGRLEEPASSWHSGDERLVRLLDLMRGGELLRFCTDLQMRCLIAQVGGRVFLPQSERVGYTKIPSTGKTRKAMRGENARALGLSEDRYKRELTRARDAVRHALSDRLERAA